MTHILYINENRIINYIFLKKFKGTTNRQMMPKFFKPTGNIYIINRDTLKKLFTVKNLYIHLLAKNTTLT